MRHRVEGEDVVPSIAELRQRKVFRVAAAYCWSRGSRSRRHRSHCQPSTHLWVLRVVILRFALGFPVALLLTWAVELNPEGLRFIPALPSRRPAL